MGAQLFELIQDLRIHDHSSLGKVTTCDASKFPYFTWPNGEPCFLANLFMLSLIARPSPSGRKLSRRGAKGGTVGDYAGKISHLIRYCYFRKTDFIQIDDAFFTDFIGALRSERFSPTSRSPKRNEKTITSIGKECLKFLVFIGNFYGDDVFVSKEGVINAYEKMHLRNYAGKEIKTYYLTHHAFSKTKKSGRRGPISKDTISLLRSSIDSDNSSNLIKQRRHCLISLLEFTGARIGELAALKVTDILSADAMDEPSLKVINLKQEEGAHRFIPVSRLLLNELKKHIRTYRYHAIKENLGLRNDHDLFFVSDRDGTPINEGTLSKEIGTLRRLARISTKACAHMFRHAFCTNLFVLLIHRHELENADAFRRMLLDSEAFKIEVMQWTGHRHVGSLEHYIHLAFKECANYGKIVSSVRLIIAHECFDRQCIALTKRLQSGLPFTQFQHEMDELRRLRDEDFAIAKVHDD